MIDRFLLSRLESLCESFKSSEGGQRRVCVLCSVPLSLHSANPTDSPSLASMLVGQCFYSDAGACGGKTLISRLNLYPSATCRALRACPLWHLWSVSASALQTRKPPPNTTGQHTFARLSLITSAPSSPARRQCITDIFIFKVHDGTHVILLLCFLCV